MGFKDSAHVLMDALRQPILTALQDVKFKDQNCNILLYMDDLLVTADSEGVAQRLALQLMRNLSYAGLKVNMTKSTLCFPSQAFSFLGLWWEEMAVSITDHTREKLQLSIERWRKNFTNVTAFNRVMGSCAAISIVSPLSKALFSHLMNMEIVK